jgi:hypothetical protein
MFGHILDCRTDETKLKDHNATLFYEFENIRAQFDVPDIGALPPSSTQQTISRSLISRDTFDRLSELIKSIRLIDGFENFLSVPTEAELGGYTSKDTSANGQSVVLGSPTGVDME